MGRNSSGQGTTVPVGGEQHAPDPQQMETVTYYVYYQYGAQYYEYACKACSFDDAALMAMNHGPHLTAPFGFKAIRITRS